MLSLRSTPSCVTRRATRASAPVVVVRRVAVRSTPKDVDAKLEKAISDANDCNGTKDCAAKWDEVEELSAAKSHLKDNIKADPALSDPLEQFCQTAPDADECRVYED